MRVLLLRSDRLGDALLSLPAAAALKAAQPRWTVAFLASPLAAPLLRLCPDVDEVLASPRDPRALPAALRAWHPDAVVALHPVWREAWASWRAGVPRRIGVRGRWYAPLFSRRVALRRSQAGLHEAEGSLRLLEPLLGWVPPLAAARLSLPANEGTVLPPALAGHPYAVLHPGCGDSAPNLEPRRFRLLAARLLERTDWRLALTGTSAEAPLVEELAQGLDPARVHRLAGALDLVGLARLIGGARLLLAGSTGPLHLAALLGTPLLSWFCPAPTRSARRWGPLGQLEWALEPKVEPCRSRRRCPHGNCLDHLSDGYLLERLDARLAAIHR